MSKEDNKPLCDRILDRIDSENISPCPKWQFWCVHSGVWVLWAVSVVVGAIALSVMFYVATHARFALYEATHQTRLSFFVEVLPYLWLLVFVVMTLIAYHNFRKTKKGYKYPFVHVVFSSLLFSLLGGFLLHVFGVGYLIDHALDSRMPTYPSLEKMEERMWQKPEEGRILGVWSGNKLDDMTYSVLDINGDEWSVAVYELREKDLNFLETKQQVKILGTTTDRTGKRFHACGAFPWMINSETKTKDLVVGRQDFVERMYDHMETKDRLVSLEKELYPNKPLQDQVFITGLCADIAAVKRVMFTR